MDGLFQSNRRSCQRHDNELLFAFPREEQRDDPLGSRCRWVGRILRAALQETDDAALLRDQELPSTRTSAGDPDEMENADLLRDDEQLWLRFVKGEPEAVREVFEHYTPLISRVIHQRVRHPVQEQDVLQKVLLKLWINREAYNREGSYAAYTSKVASNEAKDHFKLNRRHEHDPLLDEHEYRASSPEARAAARKLLSRLDEEFKSLGGKCEAIARRYFCNGQSELSIATQLELPRKRVRACMKRAREVITRVGQRTRPL